MVFEVPPFIVDGDIGWCVTYNNVTGEGDDVASKRGTVGVREGEFLYDPKDFNMAGRFFNDDEESWPFLPWKGC